MMATAGIVASVQTAAPATSSSPASARQKAAVTVSIVPGVIGPGGGLQSSKKAKWAVIGKYGTGKVGKKVVLQKQVRVEVGDRRQVGGRQEGQRHLRRARPRHQAR